MICVRRAFPCSPSTLCLQQFDSIQSIVELFCERNLPSQLLFTAIRCNDSLLYDHYVSQMDDFLHFTSFFADFWKRDSIFQTLFAAF